MCLVVVPIRMRGAQLFLDLTHKWMLLSVCYWCIKHFTMISLWETSCRRVDFLRFPGSFFSHHSDAMSHAWIDTHTHLMLLGANCLFPFSGMCCVYPSLCVCVYVVNILCMWLFHFHESRWGKLEADANFYTFLLPKKYFMV